MLVTNLELGLIDFNSLKCSMWKFLLFEINVTKKVILATGFLTSVSYDPRVNSRVVTPFASFGWLFNDRNHDSFGIADEMPSETPFSFWFGWRGINPITKLPLSINQKNVVITLEMVYRCDAKKLFDVKPPKNHPE